ncbi:PIG-U-domain-containing protein [Auriscalpium vulgare]|uniref:PIG-U-domain-containing protein n=1 Tax=Auriscalpium vulgare TaxID=40419 RepID=A0ACB8RVP1_9AGAM|nr:PIG-U-domain-containing protein [Auriscalpium vulgare]
MAFQLAFAVLLRLGLALSPLRLILKDDDLLSSPLTSHSRLREGIYLFQHGIDPYSGGTFRHSPLFLSTFATVLPSSGVVCALLWLLVDAAGAWALVQIWRARSRLKSSRRDEVIAATYLLNPYIFLPSLSLSTSTFETTLHLISLMFASQGQASPALLILAISTNLSLPSLMLLPPTMLLLLTDPVSHLASPKPFPAKLTKTLPLLVEFLAYFAVLVLACSLVAGGWGWIESTWGAGILLPDLTPNPGLWWYFFTEMFDYFRPFFLMVFTMHLLIYVAPVCIKYQHDPLYATFLLLGIIAIFKPYPTLSDPGLFLSLIALFPETYPHLRYPIVTTLLHLHAALLLPLFHHLWLATGTGNANFFYASTLVFGIANGGALLDCAWAGLRVAIGEADERWVVLQE